MRSLFWPFFLIAMGVIWLLINLGTVPAANLWALANLLPYLLLALGVSLILRAIWPIAGVIVPALTVVGMLLAVVYAPQLGWNTAPAWGWSLNAGGTVPGSGKVVTETRDVADFTAVSIDFPAQMTIRQGATQSVSVTAEDNLLPQLGTRVSNGVLHIEDKEPNWSKRVYPTKTVQLTLTVKDLKDVSFPSAGMVRIEGLQTDTLSISVSGAGSLTLAGVNIRSLHIDLSGAGTVTAEGTAGEADLNVSGVGNFRGADLAAQTASVDISGAGSVIVWVKDQLTVGISGAGSVGYYGSPSVSKDMSGLGSVNKLGNK
jgi:hypothetical protein